MPLSAGQKDRSGIRAEARAGAVLLALLFILPNSAFALPAPMLAGSPSPGQGVATATLVPAETEPPLQARFTSPAVADEEPGISWNYSQMLEAAAEGQITKARIVEQDATVIATLASGLEAVASYPREDKDLPGRLDRAGVEVTIEPIKVQSGRSTALSLLMFAPLLLLVLLAVLITIGARRARREGTGQTEAGRARWHARKAGVAGAGGVPAVRFTSVAGCDEAVEELSEIVEFLKRPDQFRRLGARMPSGVILHGPPGTGKTLLAKALAGEAGVAFYPTSGSEFVEKFVGVGASRIRELFKAASSQSTGAVIFIDELDAVGRRRSGGEGGTDERDQTLNQLLVELDGFDGRERVVCVAATNRIDVLDPALLRPGRFGRQIVVELPGEKGRREILALHAAGKPLAPDSDLDRLAHVTHGLSGAQLADILNEAAIMAARAQRARIENRDIQEGYLRVLAGPERRNAPMAKDELRVIAIHEAGHVLCAELCPSHPKAQRATVRPRGRAAGLALFGRTDRMLSDERQLREQMICALGGRAAERSVFGTISSGAANDLLVVNSIARQAIEELGFSPRLGQVVSRNGVAGLRMAESTLALIDEEVSRLVADAYEEALRLVETNRPVLERLADLLLEHGDIERVDIALAVKEATGTASQSTPLPMSPQPEPVAVPPEERRSPPVRHDDSLLDRMLEGILLHRRRARRRATAPQS